MTAVLTSVRDAVVAALDTVLDPELDEPVTDLGFVRSVEVDVHGATVVHLRLPTSFCAPNFAWLMAGDAREAVAEVPGVTAVTVELDDHHDSDLINAGLARGDDYKGTFGHEAEDSLDELRLVFRRKAHVAAMERALTSWLHADASRSETEVAQVTLGDLPPGREHDALLTRRASLGLSLAPSAPVLVEPDGTAVAPADAVKRLRMARSVRISIDGNAHFCRGLLQTRYPGSEADQAPRADGDGAARRTLPLLATPGGSRS
ncbi:metal-sulfur cluster assembly factor [Jatrophihabitans sp. YIM 134969]